jgi:hypothetical protein
MQRSAFTKHKAGTVQSQTFHNENIHAVQWIVEHELTATFAHGLDELNGFRPVYIFSSRLPERIVTYYVHAHAHTAGFWCVN